MLPNRSKQFVAVWLCLVGLSPLGSAADPALSPEEALGQISSYKFGQSRQALSVVEDMALRACSAPDEASLMSARLSPLLATDATRECKQFVCRQLAVLGCKESVPALSAVLLDEQLSDMARYALEDITDASAEQALLRGLAQADGRIRVGIINSLGDRQDAAAVPELAKQMTAADLPLAEAAIVALGKIGGDDAAAALANGKNKIPDQLHTAVIDASLKCADRFSQAGEQAKASVIYETAFAASEPALLRAAALRGLATVDPKQALPLVVSQLADGPSPLRAAAVGLLREMPGDDVTIAIVDQLPKISPTLQAALITVLADRGDTAALPAVAAALKSQDQSVRIAGLRALGPLGGKRAVDTLARAASGSADAEQEAARASLAILRGDNVDVYLLSSLKNTSTEAREELAQCLGPRNAVNSVETLLQTATDEAAAVRVASLQSLGDLATDQEMPALVKLLLQSRSDGEREAAGRAITAVARRSNHSDRGIEAPLAALRDAKDAATKAQLIGVVGEIGGPRAVPPIVAQLQDENAAVRKACVSALVACSDPAALPALLQLTKTGNADERLPALQGYIRTLGLPSSHSPQETVEAYAEAFSLATNAEEKKQIIAGLQRVNVAESLNFVLEHVTDEELSLAAATAVVRLTDPGRRSQISREEAKAAMRRLLEVSTDERVRDRATRFLEAPESR